jgi:threonine dehydrogenase-like Zn-dependent dehydrogenase
VFAAFHESLRAKPADSDSFGSHMARVLIVGCGCRGQALARALSAEGHAVRGTTRSADRLAAISDAGAEAVTADPDRLVTMMPAIEGVTVVCWLMGTASDAPELHGPRLESMLEHIVDTPARGLVYETGGEARPAGVAAAERISATYSMPVELLTVDPALHDAWLAQAVAAVGRVLSA